jgi:hypothetical protein
MVPLSMSVEHCLVIMTTLKLFSLDIKQKVAFMHLHEQLYLMLRGVLIMQFLILLLQLLSIKCFTFACVKKSCNPNKTKMVVKKGVHIIFL